MSYSANNSCVDKANAFPKGEPSGELLGKANAQPAVVDNMGAFNKLCSLLKHFLSHDSGPFAQFIKYGVIGVLATGVQTGVFYLFASTCLKCLAETDWAVRLVGLPAAQGITDDVRALRFVYATAIGFVVANVFCWLMNRWFVFKPGKYRWFVELGMFFGAATFATMLALGLSAALIRWMGLMTTIAVFVEVVVSFLVNFFVRKFVIFKR